MSENISWPKRAALLVATGAGAGYAPLAPGTAGSLLSAGLFALARFEFPWRSFFYWHLAAIAFLFFVGVWTSSIAEEVVGRRDPGCVVIDEIVGQQISYFGLGGLEWKSWLAGIILFRVFDIWKPFPIRRLERLPRGWGLMLDDVLAGIYALAVLRLWHHFVS